MITDEQVRTVYNWIQANAPGLLTGNYPAKIVLPNNDVLVYDPGSYFGKAYNLAFSEFTDVSENGRTYTIAATPYDNGVSITTVYNAIYRSIYPVYVPWSSGFLGSGISWADWREGFIWLASTVGLAAVGASVVGEGAAVAGEASGAVAGEGVAVELGIAGTDVAAEAGTQLTTGLVEATSPIAADTAAGSGIFDAFPTVETPSAVIDASLPSSIPTSAAPLPATAVPPSPLSSVVSAVQSGANLTTQVVGGLAAVQRVVGGTTKPNAPPVAPVQHRVDVPTVPAVVESQQKVNPALLALITLIGFKLF